MTPAPPAPEPSAPIPGLRTMAVVRWALLGAVALTTLATWWLLLRPDQAPRTTRPYYCPMHPQIRAAAPGTCPICFMNLEPLPAERAAPAAPTRPPSAAAVAAPPAMPSVAPGSVPPGLQVLMLTPERQQAAGLVTAPVVERVVGRELRLPARVEAARQGIAELRVRVPAFVERIAPLELGAHVRAGQPLVWVFSPDLLRAQHELLAAQTPALAAMASAAHQQLLGLGVAEEDIQALLRRGRAERALPLRAPISAVVSARNVALGGYVTPEALLFELTDLRRLWVTAAVPESELAMVPAGTRGRFRPAGGGAEHAVQASLIEPSVNADTVSARVRFGVAHGRSTLRPGAVGELHVTLAPQRLLLVPQDAVVDYGALQQVFVAAADGVFEPRAVAVGATIAGSRVVRAGLQAGERVVTRGGFVLDAESRLQAALMPTAPFAPAHVPAGGGRR